MPRQVRVECGRCNKPFDMVRALTGRCKKLGTKPVCKACRQEHDSTPGGDTLLLPCGQIVPNDETILRAVRGKTMGEAAILLGCSRWHVFKALKRSGKVKKVECCKACGRAMKNPHAAKWK